MNPTRYRFVSVIWVGFGLMPALRQDVLAAQEMHIAFSVAKQGNQRDAEMEDTWTCTYLQTTFAIQNKAAAETKCVRNMAKANHPPSTFW
jgi:hypothetical protein